MSKEHGIVKQISSMHFLEMLNYTKPENIRITKHSFIRLQEKERKIFKEKIIIDLLIGKTPVFVGLQLNNLYAVSYRYGKELLKIILKLEADEIKIITFHISNRIPRIKNEDRKRRS